MSFRLPKIYPITAVRVSGLSHTEQTKRLIAGGARFLQLREKHLPSGAFYEDALAAVRIAHERGAKIIINDRVDIAAAVGADGVHLGQDDLPPVEARKILGPDALIGYSTHNREQALEAVGLPIDYLAFGPIFLTATKEHADPTVGLKGLRAIRAIAGRFPLVAIGGISAENLSAVLEAGADSVAIISALVGGGENIADKMTALAALASNNSVGSV